MNRLELIRKKIFNKSDVESMAAFSQLLAFWRFKGETIVFTNGCFDILHRGHIDYLSKASDAGTILILGLNTDSSVCRLKGSSRPINDENARAEIIAALGFIDAVVLFEEETPYDLIKLVQPDILVKGSDYAVKDIVGHDVVEAKNGKVITIDFLEGYSTSLIEKKIQNNNTKP
jgi:D-glycero-beta-D-manno-heptose 1-phosphate adenylyltransferase